MSLRYFIAQIAQLRCLSLSTTSQRGSEMANTILRLPVVLNERGRSRSAHYQDIQQGLFTHPVQIGLRAVGWPENEVIALNAARIAGKSNEEIRQLVIKLETARKTLA